jgi:lysyl-tRNA synthetase class 2
MSGQPALRDPRAARFYNEQFKKWDIGDIIGAEGVIFKPIWATQRQGR